MLNVTLIPSAIPDNMKNSRHSLLPNISKKKPMYRGILQIVSNIDSKKAAFALFLDLEGMLISFGQLLYSLVLEGVMEGSIRLHLFRAHTVSIEVSKMIA